MLTADDFNTLTPTARAFYHSWRDQYLRQYRPTYTDPLIYLVDLTPIQIANRQLKYEIANALPANLDTPTMETNTDYPSPTPSLIYDYNFDGHYADQYYAIPYFYGPTYTRLLKVHKTYWTGISRHRRNR